MNNFAVNNQTAGVGFLFGAASPGTAHNADNDFKGTLKRLYNRAIVLVNDYNNNKEKITVEGYGTFDKTSAALQVAVPIFLSRTEEQLSMLMSIFKFVNDTLPKMIESNVA